MSKLSKLYLLCDVANEESVMIFDEAQFQNGNLLYLLPDSRRSQGYTTDGEIAFVGMDVLRGKGQVIDLASLPNVGENIESLALLTSAQMQLIELEKPVEGGASFLFVTTPLSESSSIVGYTTSDMRLEQVQSMVNQVNALHSHQHDSALEHDHAENKQIHTGVLSR